MYIQPSRKLLLIMALLIMALPVAYYVATSYAIYDDLNLFPRLDAGGIVNGLTWSDGWLGDPSWKVFRPFTHGVLWAMPRLFGRQFWLYHLFIYACHALNAALLFALALRLTGKKSCAFVAGALFFFHQANAEVVTWIAANHAIHAVTFALLSLLCLSLFLSGGRVLLYLFSLIAFTLGLLSEEAFPVVLLYCVLLAEIFFRGAMPLRRRILTYLPFVASLIFYGLLRRSVISAPVVGTGFLRPFYMPRHAFWIVRSLFLPYDTMCFPPAEEFYRVLCVLLACAYAWAFSLFLYRSKLRNGLFWFSLLCLAAYVAGVSSFKGDEKVAYFACPFYALMIASLFTLRAPEWTRPYRAAAVGLAALLLLNNYSLLLLRTRDWSTAGGVNRDVTRLFVEQFPRWKDRTVHAVGFNAIRQLYLKGEPQLGPVDEQFNTCHWFWGMPAAHAYDPRRFRVWSTFCELARAYRSGGGVKDDDIVVSLKREGSDGAYRFTLSHDTAGRVLPGIADAVGRPGDAFPLRVNFQAYEALAPLEGFQIDEGRGYAPWRGYGWDRELTGVDMNWERWSVVDMDRKDRWEQARDTFVWQFGKATWEIDLPDGVYYVSAGWGNTHFVDMQPQQVALEGKIAGGNGPMGPSDFMSFHDVPVTVRDGSLTLELIPSPPSGRIIISYLVISRERGVR